MAQDSSSLSEEEIKDANVQMAKFYDYMGDVFNSMEIYRNYYSAAKAGPKCKMNAKLRYLYVLELKRTLVFHECMSEADAFIADYSDQESYAWKYLYKTYVVKAKLFQMLNSLEKSQELMEKALQVVERNSPSSDSVDLGIMYRSFGYQYWKFYKKARADEYLNKALAIFEKLKNPHYLISTIYKEKGDMHKELQEADQAQNCYEQCIRYRRLHLGEHAHFSVEKIFFRLADNMMKERCNEQKLRRAEAYLQKDREMIYEILEMGSEEEEGESTSLYLAMHYQFRGKLSARHLAKEECLANYRRAEAIFLRAGGGKPTLIMQSFFQFAIDDFAEVGLEELANEYNHKYKDTLKLFYQKDNLFYIAYTIDIVAQEMQTKPMKAFYKVKRAQAVIEPFIGRDSLIGLIF